MNRYTYILDKISSEQSERFIGIFPWELIIDKTTDVRGDQINFLDEGMDFLHKLSAKKIAVVMFINQFKTYPLSMEKFGNFVSAIENFVKGQGVDLKGVYWCPGTDKRDPFVVPNPGMFLRVTENLGTDWTNIPVLSVSEIDLSAAVKVKATPIKIGSKHNKHQSFESLAAWLDSQ
jgi:histidinol phosphatase-like enzyme